LPGGRVWHGDFEPHFLKPEEWGFLFVVKPFSKLEMQVEYHQKVID
jgi:hypothetical protein